MKYLTIEIQTSADGAVAQIATVHDTEPEAWAAYHTVLAVAALSELPMHACVIVDGRGRFVASECYGQAAQQGAGHPGQG